MTPTTAEGDAPRDQLHDVTAELREARILLAGVGREIEPEFVLLGAAVGELAALVAKASELALRARNALLRAEEPVHGTAPSSAARPEASMLADRAERVRRATVVAMECSDGVLSGASQVAAHTDQVLVSLQHPDIARQKIEHIVAAIDGLVEALDAGQAPCVDQLRDARLAAVVGVVVRLQCEQLTDAQRDLVLARRQAVDGVRELLRLSDVLFLVGQRMRPLTAVAAELVGGPSAAIARPARQQPEEGGACGGRVNIAGAVDPLGTRSGAGRLQFDDLASEFLRVRAEAIEALFRLEFVTTVADRLAGAERSLRAVLTATELFAAHAGDDPLVLATLASLRSKYTMKRERDLHSVAIGAGSHSAAGEAVASQSKVAPEGAGAPGADGLGDNVELF